MSDHEYGPHSSGSTPPSLTDLAFGYQAQNAGDGKCQKCGHHYGWNGRMCACTATAPPTYTQQQVDALVQAERERCAKLARDAANEYAATIEELAAEESWQWAMNEMREPINEKWNAATAKLCKLAERIESGQ